MKIVDGKKIAETPEEEEQLRVEAEQGIQNPTTPSAIEDLIRNTLAENESARRRAEQRVRELEDEKVLRDRRQVETPIDNGNNKLTKEQFWEDPVGSMNALISAQIKPLSAAAAKLTVDSTYNNLKAEYRSKFPAFAKLDSFGLIDKFMNGVDPTHANIQGAIRNAVGELALTDPVRFAEVNGTPSNNNVPDPKDPDNKIAGKIPPDPQAHMRPTLRRVETDGDKKLKRRPLTELELRIVAETKKTDPTFDADRYLDLLESGNKVDDFKKKVVK